MFGREQARLLAERTGGADPDRLIACVEACGFDAGNYLSSNVALQSAGLDAGPALFHFLAHGYAEHRNLTCSAFPDGLDGISSLRIPHRDYAVRLFCSMFFGQMRNPRTADRLWNGIARGHLECVRAMGGIPYVVIGDSHAGHYLRLAWRDGRWLAALPMVCHGGSATDLADESSRLGYGARMLRWARATADLASPLDLPIFLKFGGIDTEFLWIRHRIRNRIYRFSVAEFDHFARESVFRYGCFLDAFASVVDRGLLRICTTFPAVLGDASWHVGFLHAHRVSPERDCSLANELKKIEVPGRSTRTQLRGLYNDYLREMCRAKSLIFVDDFSPLLDANGDTSECCYAGHGGHGFHVDYHGSEQPLLKVIYAYAC